MPSPDNVLYPHSAEAEQAVLGSILIDPASYHQVSHFLAVRHFFIVRHGWIYEAMQAVIQRGDGLDYISLSAELQARGRLDEVGGPAYLTQLMNHTPSALYVETYARLVERTAVRRGLFQAASAIAALAADENKALEAALDDSAAALAAVTADRPMDSLTPLSRITDEILADLDSGNHPGIATGFADLDVMLGGLQKSDLLIVAGRPGMGKTAWLLTVALNAARAGQRVLIFSMEMDKIQLTRRWVAMETGVSTDKQRRNQLTAEERPHVVESLARLGGLPVQIDDTPALTPAQLESKARRVYNERGVDLVIVDYVQLMTAPAGKDANRVQEVGVITRSLKQLARTLHVPVLAAAQLSRAVEQRQKKVPQLSDLRESGSIENDADVIMFIYREEVYKENTLRPNEADLVVAKHRNGPTGTVPLYFLKERTQFGNLRRAEKIDLRGYNS